MAVIVVAVGALVSIVLGTRASSDLVYCVVGFGAGCKGETTVAAVAGGGTTFLGLPRFLFSGNLNH